MSPAPASPTCPHLQDAEFFEAGNPMGQALRHQALLMALDDMEAWLETGEREQGFLGVGVTGGGGGWGERAFDAVPSTALIRTAAPPPPVAAADEAQVAVLDATNSTQGRRDFLRTRFHGK